MLDKNHTKKETQVRSFENSQKVKNTAPQNMVYLHLQLQSGVPTQRKSPNQKVILFITLRGNWTLLGAPGRTTRNASLLGARTSPSSYCLSVPGTPDWWPCSLVRVLHKSAETNALSQLLLDYWILQTQKRQVSEWEAVQVIGSKFQLKIFTWGKATVAILINIEKWGWRH